jgi:SNF2 family DNA or RNA helicase
MLRLSQLTGGFFNANKLPGADDDGPISKLVKQVSKAKLKLLDETLTDLVDQNHKVVIFTRFTAEFLAICELLARKNIKSVSMNGSTPPPLKKANVEQFQNDPETMAMAANIRCAGLGITLHASHYAIFYSFGYSLIDYEQAKDRLHRIGQRHLCTYIHLVAQHTIDAKIVRALRNKREIAKEVVDDWRQYFEDAS